MYVNLTPKQMVRLNLALAMLFICIGVYSLQSDSLPISSFTGFIFAIGFIVQAYRSTEKFAAKTALSKTLTATDTSLRLSRFIMAIKKRLLN